MPVLCTNAGVLAFPLLNLVAVKLFFLGILRAALGILISTSLHSDEKCHSSCLATGVAATIACAVFVVFLWGYVLFFNWNYRAITWKPARAPEDLSGIPDPLFRLYSFAKSLCSGNVVSLISRPRGKFVKPPGDNDEPARTERLLTWSFSPVKQRGGDYMDAFGFAVMPRASGVRFYTTSFDAVVFSTAFLITILTAMGRTWEPGSAASIAQLTLIFVLQFLVVIYALFGRVTADRLEAALTVGQFLMESTASLALLLATTMRDTQEQLQNVSFASALLAITLPVLKMLYDALVVQLFKLCCLNKLSPKAAFFIVVGFGAVATSYITKLMGIKHGGGTGLASLNEARKLGAKASDGKLLIEVADGLDEIMSSAFWLANAGEMHQKAALNVQKIFRAHSGRRKLREQQTSAIYIQHAFRSSRRNILAQQEKMPDACNGAVAERPGFAWLESTVSHTLYQERLERAREQKTPLPVDSWWLATIEKATLPTSNHAVTLVTQKSSDTCEQSMDSGAQSSMFQLPVQSDAQPNKNLRAHSLVCHLRWKFRRKVKVTSNTEAQARKKRVNEGDDDDDAGDDDGGGDGGGD